MDRWTLVGMVVIAAGGTLAFLRVVCNEVALQLRALTARLEREARERSAARAAEAANQVLDTASADDEMESVHDARAA